jgi:leucyl aminopeptidase
MALEISTKVKSSTPDTLIIGIDGSGRLPKAAAALSDYTHLLGGKGEDGPFTGKWGQTLTVQMPKGSDFTRAVLVGIKSDKKLKSGDWATLGGKITAALKNAGAVSALLPAHDKKSGLVGTALANIAEGMMLASYSFDVYKAPKKDADKNKLKSIVIDVAGDRKTDALITTHLNVATGAILTRDLSNEPPNVLYPESYADRIKRELAPLGVKVEIFDEKALAKHKMGGILGVGQGSERPPRMVILHWNGLKSDKSPPLALVGKGVTFDTGGIDIKPATGMEEMKFDMAGSAAVVGTMKALALNKAKVNVIGAVGLAENMPSHNAYRPSDVLTSYSGKTVEVLNTDAEGRLVLMDVLSYVQKTHKPGAIIDLATLTGAIVVALGSTFAGAFVNNDKLWSELNQAGIETGERLWRMPLDEDYRKAMEGSITDLQNLSNWDRAGGSCTAAGFLEHFIEDKTPWAHLDIAATAWGKASALGPKGASGYGVRLLYNYIMA